jgi:hypothetical protein
MKRVKLTALVTDQAGIDKKAFTYMLGAGAELEHYEEKFISKDKDFFQEHSFDTLLDNGKDFVNGSWQVAKGLFGLAKWALIVIFAGLMWVWKIAWEGLHEQPKSKKEEKNGKHVPK